MTIYQHFRKDEQSFIDKILGFNDWVITSSRPKLLDFLTPREQMIVQSLVAREELLVAVFYPDNDHVERKRCIIAPNVYQQSEQDFAVVAFRLEYAAKFANLTHKHVLGTLMSLGVDRGKFGDIYVHDGTIDIIAVKEFSDFVAANVDRVGPAAVRVSPIDLAAVKVVVEAWQERVILVSSLRLDALIAEILRVSRQKSQQIIDKEKVKVNWQSALDNSFEVGVDDILSIRGFGRVKILQIDGQTKKLKWRVVIGELKA